MIVGIGIDIVKNIRVQSMYRMHGKAFLRKILTKEEIKEFNKHPRIDRLCGIFAAKEAVIKAYTSTAGKLSFKHFSILHRDSGSPYVYISDFKKIAGKDRVIILLSLSHELQYTIAIAIIEKNS